MNDYPVTRWWWVRHAPVVDAHLQQLSGQADVAADVSDGAAFAALAPHLPVGAVWVTSHLKRTNDTAQALWQAGADRGDLCAEPAFAEPAFAEQAFGDWTHCTWAELGARTESKAFWDAPAEVRPPTTETGQTAESFAEVCARVAPRIEDLTAAHAGRDIICVAHAGSIRAAVALALGLTPAQALGLDVKNLGLTRLEHMSDGLTTKRAINRGGNWRVVGLNQIC